MKKLTKVGIVLAVVTVAEIAVFEHYNALLDTKPAVTSTVAATPNTPVGVNVVGFKPFLDNSLLTVSEDHSKFAYIDSSSVLRVEDIETHKELYHLQLLIKPVYLRWINGTMLFIGTEVDNGGTKDLRLSTIDISVGQPRLIQSFAGLSSDSTFKQITFSPSTNDVFILVGNQYSTEVYHFDANSTLNTVQLGGRYVSNLGVTSTTGEMYFQDFAEGTKNVLSYANSEVHLIQRNAILLRVTGNVLYYGVLDANGNVTSIQKYQNGTSSTVTTMQSPADPANVLLTEDDDVLVLSNGSYINLRTNQTTSVPSGSQTMVKDNCLFIIRPGRVSVVM